MLVLQKIDTTGGRKVYRPSAYNLHAETPAGDNIYVNSLSGSQILLPGDTSNAAVKALSGGRTELTETNRGVIGQLIELGLLVKEGDNELRQLRYLQAHQTSSMKRLHVILFPTEKCNFRCIYCYEDFAKGKMSREVRDAVKTFLTGQTKTLKSLDVDWFGGEPLLAFDVIKDILPEVKAACDTHNCRLGGHITTNGYLLTPEIANQLLDWGVESFQITLDGPREEHNKRRPLHKSSGNELSSCQCGTFDRILENVKSLLAQRRIFNLILRTNYDLDSLPKMTDWIDTLASLVGGDPRVVVDFCPIWADPCNVDVSIPVGQEKQRTYSELFVAAHAKGLQTGVSHMLRLGGLVCYAAKANSFVVRSDGAINKCTVALDADYNHVGRLKADGSLDIDLDRFAKWTSSGLEEDQTCQSCSLSPSCQGNACPLDRFENHRRPCPPPKNFASNLFTTLIPDYSKEPDERNTLTNA